MGRIIAIYNTTLDAICDHTAGIPDAEIHDHYTELLAQGDAILYGRITYQLMEYWRTHLAKPSEHGFMNDFAGAINKIPKLVFSNSLKNLDWESAALAEGDLKDEVLRLKAQPGKDIFVGSRSLIMQLLKLDLIDEFQLCIYPVVAGKGKPLFADLDQRIVFRLVKNKVFNCGAVILYYRPKMKTSQILPSI